MAEKTQGHNTKHIEETILKIPDEPQKPETIRFDYIKSNQFRVVHVDGVHGGVSPNGRLIQMAIFSERAPIPIREEFKLDAGKLGDKIGTEQRDAVVREVEVELLMSIDTAKSICTWMDERIKLVERIQAELPKP